ncbi:MAG: response regulator, partial [Limisphaerales bacterium]
LPLMNGFDVLRWVKQQQFSSPLNVIILSGSPHDKDRTLAFELGARDYLVKPVDAETLKKRLLQLNLGI